MAADDWHLKQNKKPLQRVTNMNKQDEPTEAQPCKALTGLWELHGTYVSGYIILHHTILVNI